MWAWRPSWSCDQHRLNKLSFSHPMETPYEIWLQSVQWFLRRRCLKRVDEGQTTDRHDGRTDGGRRRPTYPISSPLSLRLRWAKKLPTYHWKSFESMHGETMLKMGWMVKNSGFSLLNVLISTKILIVSQYISLTVYTNFNTLGINWKFDLLAGSFREKSRLNHRSPYTLEKRNIDRWLTFLYYCFVVFWFDYTVYSEMKFIHKSDQ